MLRFFILYVIFESACQTVAILHGFHICYWCAKRWRSLWWVIFPLKPDFGTLHLPNPWVILSLFAGVVPSGIHHQPVRLRPVGRATVMMKTEGWGEVVVRCNYSKMTCLGKRNGKGTVWEEACCLLTSHLFQECKTSCSVCATLVTFFHLNLYVGLAWGLCCSLLLPRIYLICSSLAMKYLGRREKGLFSKIELTG